MKNVTRSLALLVAVAALGMLARPAQAGGGCCNHCGTNGNTGKVCRLVCETAEIEVTCWSSECEDFCVPGPCRQGCTHCDDSPCDDGCCNSCSSCKGGLLGMGGRFAYTESIPDGQPRMLTRKVLLRKTVTKEVPVYRWVVEDLCSGCEANCEAADIVPGAEVPPPPPIEANFKYGRITDEAVHVELGAATPQPRTETPVIRQPARFVSHVR